MQVVFDLREILFQKRGWERYGTNLIRKLLFLPKIRCSFIVEDLPLAKKHYSFLFKNDPKVIERPKEPNPREAITSDPVLIDFIESHDIFHNLTEYPDYLPKTAKLIITLHDLSFFNIKEYFDKDCYDLWHNNLIQMSSLADGIICCSNSTIDNLYKFLKIQNIDIENTIFTVYEGISADFYPTNNNAELILEKFNITQPYFIYVGGIEKDKNVQKLIEGFNLFYEKNDSYSLLLAGPYLPENTNLTETRHSNIKSVGYISHSDLLAAYTNADFFLSASLDEGFGFCPLEALRCGTPSILSDIPCFRETMQNKSIFFDPLSANSIAEALSSASFNIENIYDSILPNDPILDRFNWAETARNTYDIYEKILKI
jgi:glycosyltransferase involved in cell wall biosynthesis